MPPIGLWRAAAVAALALTTAQAHASGDSPLVPPPIAGHVTDPDHRLTADEHRDIEGELDRIQSDTSVDVATFLSNVPAGDLDAAGRAAYDRWGIGKSWENGVLIAFSRDGQAHLVLAPGRSAVDPATAAQVELAATTLGHEGQLGLALRSVASTLGATLRARAHALVARPPGQHDWRGSALYALGAVAILAAALIASMRRLSWRFPRWVGARVDVVLMALLAAGAWARAFRLAHPVGSLIFDESYYVQDARVILGLPVTIEKLPAHALSGLDPNGEHPPLAKLIMAASMNLFGPTAASSRLPSVVLGVLSIWLIHGIVSRAGGTRSQARLAAFVMAFENLAFVHGRIATLDVYLATFMLLGTLLYLGDLFELAAIAFGVATLCKLNGVFGVVAIVLFEGARRWQARRGGESARSVTSVIWLVGVYAVFTLLALGALDRGWTEFRGPFAHVDHMVRYAASLRRPDGMRGDESTPLQWWLDEVQMKYLQVEVTTNNVTRTTVLFRGALTESVLAIAPFALGYAALVARRGSKLGALAVALFAANYGPVFFAWLLASRTSYIYYMLPSVPAIALALAALSSAVPRVARWGFVVSVLFTFAAWFPFRWY